MPVMVVDGCRAGWVAVTIDEDGGWACALHPSMVSLWSAAVGVGRVWVDMPIGLPERGKRQADFAARQVLGKRRSSVFGVPSRAAAYAPDYAAANRLNRETAGVGLSVQAWNITGKICELDSLLRFDPSIGQVMAESHPEVVFWALNGRQPMAHPKKTPDGNAERLAVLARHYPPAAEVLADAAQHIPRKQAALDDVVDALCLAVGARAGGVASLPPTPPTDSFGLPMRVMYPLAGES
jgi:predicted RNase H-like nuclease